MLVKELMELIDDSTEVHFYTYSSGKRKSEWHITYFNKEIEIPKEIYNGEVLSVYTEAWISEDVWLSVDVSTLSTESEE